jgi:hypothetical protein
MTYVCSISYEKTVGRYCFRVTKVLELKALKDNGQAYAKRDPHIQFGGLLTTIW